MDRDINSLHDSTLIGADMNWANRKVVLTIETAKGAVRIECLSVTRFTLPMEYPWGPSVSINNAAEESGMLRIEMQSGDEIVICAESFQYCAGAA